MWEQWQQSLVRERFIGRTGESFCVLSDRRRGRVRWGGGGVQSVGAGLAAYTFSEHALVYSSLLYKTDQSVFVVHNDT